MKRNLLLVLVLCLFAALLLVGCQEEHVHSLTEFVPNGDATCTTDGNETATCTTCEAAVVRTVANSALGHSFTNYVSNNDATCTENGTETAKCDRCEATDTRTAADSALGHSFTNYVSNNDATCTEDGTETAKCDRCEATDTRTAADSALGHDYAPATCTTPKTCKRAGCGHTDGEALHHSFTNYVSNNDATCTEDGTETAKCDRCEVTDTRTVADSALGHDYAPATCTTPKTCKRAGCGHTDGEALRHSFTNYVSNNDATCTGDGTETAKCDRCEVTDTRTVADSALGHSYGEVTYVWSGDYATCTATRTCARNAGHVETEIAISTSTVTQQRSCTSDELTKYTATFTNPAFAQQVKENVKTADAAHNYALDAPCTGCGAYKPLRILAIGNSFSVDTMEYLYDVARSAGVQNVILGNMYIGGCSVATHLQHAKANDGAYTYYKNTTGTWTSASSVKFATALCDEDWDYITIQQTSKTCGIASSYGQDLKDLVDIVLAKRTNPSAQLLWHMTWAYQQDSTHASFPNYNSDQMTMYNMTVEAVKTQVLTNTKFDGVIATGTAIQNARTSFAGDHLTRDGYHLNKTLGRYIGALSWYATITGGSLDKVTFKPSADITAVVAAMAKDAVASSIKTPYAVTASAYPAGTGTWDSDPSRSVVDPEDCYESDRALAAAKGIDLDKYDILIYDYRTNQYWQCTKNANIQNPSATGSVYQTNICTQKIYAKAEIGEGAVIICDEGWQFRPELWVSLSVKEATRPGFRSAGVTVLDAEFWASFQYFAFNVATDPRSNISDCYAAAASHVRVYIPKKAS